MLPNPKFKSHLQHFISSNLELGKDLRVMHAANVSHPWLAVCKSAAFTSMLLAAGAMPPQQALISFIEKEQTAHVQLITKVSGLRICAPGWKYMLGFQVLFNEGLGCGKWWRGALAPSIRQPPLAYSESSMQHNMH